MYQNYLADPTLAQSLEDVDRRIAEDFRLGRCPRCGSALHGDNYPRKPRGGPEGWTHRLSFTCAKHRHRLTPPSVRFLGRKVFAGVVFVLVSALQSGLSPQRVKCLKEHLQINRRTLSHWRDWWRRVMVATPFWKVAAGRFSPPVSASTMPASLCERFETSASEGVRRLLEFFCPLTTASPGLSLELLEGVISSRRTCPVT